jgi:hypothetical protein
VKKQESSSKTRTALIKGGNKISKLIIRHASSKVMQHGGNSRDAGNSEHGVLIAVTLTTAAHARQLLVTANLVTSSPNLVTLTMEALSSSETPVLTRATRRIIPQDDILHGHRHENLKSYIALTG